MDAQHEERLCQPCGNLARLGQGPGPGLAQQLGWGSSPHSTVPAAQGWLLAGKLSQSRDRSSLRKLPKLTGAKSVTAGSWRKPKEASSFGLAEPVP